MTKKLLLVTLLISLVVAFFALGGDQYLNLTAIQQNKEFLADYVEQQFWLSIVLAMAIYIFVVSLSLPGASFLSLAVGFVFGRWLGWSLLLISATIGATIVFWLARYLLTSWAKSKLTNVTVAQKIIDEVDQNSLNYLLFLRLVPLFPFWLVNLSMAFTKIDTKRYALGTFIGIMPGSFVFANLGQSLATIENMSQIFSLELLLAFALLGLLMLLPVFVKHFKSDDSIT